MSDIGIGKIITFEAYRDAIHIAVIPMIAAHELHAGQHVGVIEKDKAGYSENPVGIVDPFLRVPVPEGAKFYLFLYPGSITSLRHHWVHPAFEDIPPQIDPPVNVKPAADPEESKKWLHEYANKVNPYCAPGDAYNVLMQQIKDKAIVYQGVDMHDFSELQEPELLKHHASIVLGYEVKWEEFEYFSCTC